MRTTTWCIASGRLRLHEPADGGVVRQPGPADRADPIAGLQVQRSGVGRAEERDAGEAGGGLPAAGESGGRPGAG